MARYRGLRFSLTISVLIVCFALLARLALDRVRADTPVSLSENSLLTTNRQQLALCVELTDFEDTAFSEDLTDRVRRVLNDRIQDHPRWKELGYNNYELRVEIDCPGEPYLLMPGATHPLLQGEAEGSPVPSVEIPSPFRIHVYIVNEETIQTAFVGTDLRSAPQEMLCEANQCFEVTTGLYLSAREAMNLRSLRDRLERALAISLIDLNVKR